MHERLSMIELIPGREGAGKVRLTWATSKAVYQSIQITADELQSVRMIEPADRTEEIPFESKAEADALLAKYQAILAAD